MGQAVSLNRFSGTIREKLTAASAYCKTHSGITLEIPAGIYTLEDSRAIEVMNEDLSGAYGMNPEPVMFKPDFPFSIGLDLDGCSDITVNAYGAVLMIHGFMEPVGIRRA